MEGSCIVISWIESNGKVPRTNRLSLGVLDMNDVGPSFMGDFLVLVGFDSANMTNVGHFHPL